VVLAENYAHEMGGNAPQVNMALMEYLRDNPTDLPSGEKKTFLQQNEQQETFFWGFLEACGMDQNASSGNSDMRHFFHVLHQDGVFYSCLSDDPDLNEHKVNLAFLDHVMKEFTRLYRARRIERANAYAMEKDFKPHFRSAMHYYNSNHEMLRRDAKIQQLTSKIERMKDVMGENIQLMLRRGETLESMSAKAESMKRDSVVFKKQSNQLKNTLKWKHRKYQVLIALFVGGIFYVCLTAACGFTFQHCRVRNGNSSNNNSNNNQNNDQNDQGQQGNRV
jgi:hypothetical protein